jgi:hypothetical protein
MEGRGNAAKKKEKRQGGCSDRKGACLSCHRVNSTGSRKAPTCPDIGRYASAGSLERSLRDSVSQMFPINRPVRAVTRDGKMINGRR